MNKILFLLAGCVFAASMTSHGLSGPSRLIKDYLPGGASRLAALLLPQILPVFSVVAPGHPGAALRNLVLVQPRRATSAAEAQATGRGTIKGHIRLTGKLPGNPIIRMGMDPMCARINNGKRTVQETVVASLDGSLANVFVTVQGSFPPVPAPTEPVTLDQRGCIYAPRVVGVRAGQTLQVRNSDDLLHNVHSLSARGNGFNVSEPKAGMVQQFHLKDEEVMVRVRCDIHSWMTAYVGVVKHPYFAVSGGTGLFEIANVPAGTHTIQAWQERYGPLTQTVRVRAGATTTVDFTYTGNEKPGTSGVQDLVLPEAVRAVQLFASQAPPQ